MNELLKPNFSRHSVINDHSKESNAFVKSRNNMAPSMLNFSEWSIMSWSGICRILKPMYLFLTYIENFGIAYKNLLQKYLILTMRGDIYQTHKKLEPYL
jgi:hypothetical protein